MSRCRKEADIKRLEWVYINFLSNFFETYNSLEEGDVFFTAMEGLLRNRADLQNASIYDMAEICGVSRTTLNRLSKLLGYGSFKEFKYDMVRSFSKYEVHNHLIPAKQLGEEEGISGVILGAAERICSDLREGLDRGQLGDIVQVLHAAGRVRLYMTGLTGAAGLQTNLAMNGKDVRIVTTYTGQLRDSEKLDDNSVVIMVDLEHPDSMDSGPILRGISQSGAVLVMLGSDSGGKSGKLADYYVDAMFMGGSISLYGVSLCLDIISTMYRKRYMM